MPPELPSPCPPLSPVLPVDLLKKLVYTLFQGLVIRRRLLHEVLRRRFIRLSLRRRAIPKIRIEHSSEKNVYEDKEQNGKDHNARFKGKINTICHSAPGQNNEGDQRDTGYDQAFSTANRQVVATLYNAYIFVTGTLNV